MAVPNLLHAVPVLVMVTATTNIGVAAMNSCDSGVPAVLLHHARA
jgi:hypothetical protein